MSFEARLEEKKALIDEYMKNALPKRAPGGIVRAMDYSVNAGGKRIRPVIAIACTEALGGSAEAVLPYAAALEMIHTYSLIHDDLPCMDNDDLRRGRPTNHKVFGEGMATLAGDALLNFAFETALGADTESEKKLKLMKIIADASGVYGMIGGQVLDMEGEKRKLSPDEITHMHDMKTGALIKAAAKIGAVSADKPEDVFLSYAGNLGLAFQLKDDILDVTQTTDKLGKPAGSDEKNDKSTFVTLYGLKGAKKLLDEATERAISSLPPNCEFLRELADYLLTRKK